MTKEQLIEAVKAYGRGFLTSKASVQRRIHALEDIETAAQQIRETLEAVLDDLEEQP